MPGLDPLIVSFAVALGIGLLIGTERERRKGEGPERSPAGIRTFALASLAGASSVTAGGMPLFTAVTAGIFALAALAYWRGEGSDPGLTTEIALVSAVLLGGLAIAKPGLAAGIAVAVASLLNAKTALHRFVRIVLSEAEIRDGLIFAAATLIVLPILPDEQMGPFAAINPRAIWIIVILVMAIGAIGHIAVRLAGSRFGLPVAGLASGFISGTATVAQMGMRSAQERELSWAASAGAVLSSIGTIVQLIAVLAATNFKVLGAVAIPLALAGAAALFYGVIFSFFALHRSSGAIDERGQAFSPWAAIAFAALLSAILLASQAMNEWFGGNGITATAAIAGLASVDPAAISVATLASAGKITAEDAAVPILIALSANTLTKAALCFSAGSRGFALRVVPGLILMVLAAWLGWWLA
jgi:uncharacterized membrane protein (DUF4010 family)